MKVRIISENRNLSFVNETIDRGQSRILRPIQMFIFLSILEGIETCENWIKQKVESLICLPKASSRIWLEEKQCSKKIISMQKRSTTSFQVMKQKTFPKAALILLRLICLLVLEVAKSQKGFCLLKDFHGSFSKPLFQ